MSKEFCQTTNSLGREIPYKSVKNNNAGTIKVTKDNNPGTLYQHQIDAMTKLNQFTDKSKFKGLLVIPTGGGKTLTAVQWTLKNIIDQNKKVLWIAHRHELLNQALNAIVNNSYRNILRNRTEFNYRVISGLHDKPVNIKQNDDFVIASKDSLAYGLNYLTKNWIKPNKDNIFVIIDEAHHAAAKSYRKIIKELEQENSHWFQMLGLTATPFRTSESEKALLSQAFEDGIIYGVDLTTLIARGILADPIFTELTTKLDLINQISDADLKRIEAFDNLPSEIAEQIAASKDRNNLIVNHYIENQVKYGNLLVFAINIPHAIELSALFKKRGIRSEFVVSSITDIDRGINISHRENEENIRKFKNGEINVLTNVEKLTEGIDLPSVQTVFLTRPTTSTILMTQMMGRALRGKKAGGTDVAYIVSFVDNWKDKIAWVNPEKLVEYEKAGIEPKSYQRPEYIRRLVAISKIEEFAVIMDETVDTTKIERLPFLERVPIGLYSFSILVPSDGELINKNCDILVYDPHIASYQEFVDNLDVIFREADLEENEILSDQELLPLTAKIMDAYFGGDRLVGNNLKDILRYYALKGLKPEFLELKDREKYDISQLAKYIWDNNLSTKAHFEYLDTLWNSENTFWRVFFGNNNKKYFLNQVQIELNKLHDPDIFLGNNSKVIVEKEEIDITRLTLSEIKEVEPDYWRTLIDGLYEKSKDADGYYYSAISNYKSKNRLNFQIDHIKPMSKGGLTTLDNLQLTSRWENQQKGDRWDGDSSLPKDSKATTVQPAEICSSAEGLIDQIGNFMDECHFEEALNYSEAGIKEHPENAVFYDIKGASLAALERFEEALFWVDSAIGKDPDNEIFYLNKGLILEDLGRVDDALKCYETVLKIDPESADAYYRKGLISEDRNQHKKALTYVNRAIELDEKFGDAFILKGDILNSIRIRKYVEAMDNFNKALALMPENIDAYLGIGYSLQCLKKYSEAIATFQKVIEIDPEISNAYFHMGYIFDFQRKYDKALKFYSKAIDLYPKDKVIYNNKGWTLEKMKKYDEALEYYYQALNLDPYYSLAKKNIDRLLKKMNKDF